MFQIPEKHNTRQVSTTVHMTIYSDISPPPLPPPFPQCCSVSYLHVQVVGVPAAVSHCTWCLSSRNCRASRSLPRSTPRCPEAHTTSPRGTRGNTPAHSSCFVLPSESKSDSRGSQPWWPHLMALVSTRTTPEMLIHHIDLRDSDWHCVVGNVSKTISVFPEMWVTPRSWKKANYTNTWRKKTTIRQFMNLENCQLQRRHGQKKENPTNAQL